MSLVELHLLTVAQLTHEIKELLEAGFPDVWVTGEISNFSRPQSGHCYLTLKDDEAQLRAVIWRTAATRVRFDLHDGLEVVCHGRLDLYPPRGSYQLVIDELAPRGIGALELALRQLKEKLAREGLFDPARKRPLPRFPRRVAFVTSPTGAAVRDFLEVLRRRAGSIDVLIVPTRVQGAGSAQEIAQAIALVNRLSEPPEVLVVGRGGGSLEDLWCFNEEPVVRAIAASQIPIISAVGHEIDVTLADLVADVRALTPSEAAERIAPAADELRQLLQDRRGRLAQALHRRSLEGKLALQRLAQSRALLRPFERVQLLGQRLDEQSEALHRGMRGRVELAQFATAKAAVQLEALSPLAVLARGYSVTERSGDRQLLRSSAQVRVGDSLRTRLSQGIIHSRVEELEP
jgi:exodeoxyribonuclease VII large subunit